MALIAPPASGEVTITTHEQQISTDPGDDYDPAISGDIVTYTANRANNTDVYYVNLNDGVEHPVTVEPGWQEFSDVSGPLIAYADVDVGDIWLYSTLTGEKVNLTASAGPAAGNPAISTKLVVWQDSRDGNSEIYAMSLATGEERRITNSAARDSEPAVRDSRIVWQACATACDIGFYDWTTGETKMLTQGDDADERRPDIDGNYVVYDRISGGERDISAYDLSTGNERQLSLPGTQNNPNVSGDVVAFEDLSTGISHLMLWHLPTDTVLPVTSGSRAEILNDIDGNRVVYSAQRDGQFDIYMTTFTLNQTGDTTAPTVTITSPTQDALTTVGDSVNVDYACNDETDGSGIASCTGTVDGTEVTDGGQLPTQLLGAHRLTVTATDKAGNTATGTADYVVFAAFGDSSGRLQPPPAVNTAVKAGATVPVKFSLDGDHGLGIFAADSPSWRQVSCSTFTGDPVDPGTPTEVAAATGLSYDSAADQYNYRWKTHKSWAGQCWQLTARFGPSAGGYAGAAMKFNFRFDK